MAMSDVYANFRISVDDAFRNEFSFAHYRKWGAMELWEGCRVTGPRPTRQRATDRIEVWRNWELVGTYTSREQARAKVQELLSAAPDLQDCRQYLDTALGGI
jgi:hypothetical protein